MVEHGELDPCGQVLPLTLMGGEAEPTGDAKGTTGGGRVAAKVPVGGNT